MRRFWWIVFLVFDVLLLVIFTAGYSARWIDPRTLWWPQLCAIALPFISIFLLPALLVSLGAKHRVQAAVHLPFIILAFIRFTSFGSPDVAPAGPDTRLTIASYNLGQFDHFSQAVQAQKLGELLLWLHPDIIGLQEFMVRFRGESLRIRNMPYIANKIDSLGYQSVATDVHDVRNTFQPILTRIRAVEQVEQERVILAEEGYPEMGVMRMRFRWRDREAVLYNVHLRTFGEKKPWLEENMSPLSFRFWLFYLRQYREAFLYRAWQADQIRAMMEQERSPLIVSGDFNSTPHNWAFYHLSQGMKDVFKEAGSVRITSYHTKFSLARIDHMLVSPHWEVYRAEIPHLEYSDHRPLLVQLGWPEGQ